MRTHGSKPFVIMAFMVLSTVAACSSLKVKEEEKPAVTNYREGLEEFSRANWSNAISSMEIVTNDYPFSQYSTLAELRIIESHFYEDSYIEALLHIQNFQDLHPTNPNMPYILFLKGESYYRQSLKTGRDPSFTENAAREYRELIERFPESPYSEPARQRFTDSRGKLASYDISVGRFYYRAAKYNPAIARLKLALDKYPESSDVDRALYYIGKSYFFQGSDAESLEAFRKLCDECAESPYCDKSKPFVLDLEGDRLVGIGKGRRFKERIVGWFGYFD
ncbi:outer membrane protein assembly factor BamD [Thermodesulfobacteriota bacterium]